MDQLNLQRLAERWNVTDHEPEPYLLTEEEERESLQHELEQRKKHFKWKMEKNGLPEMDILIRMDAINWESEINRDEILKRANANKNYDIWQRRQRQRDVEQEEKKQKEIAEKYTAEYVYKLISWVSINVYGKRIIHNDENILYLKTICFFFSNDPRFETELNYSFKKGLFLRGGTGLGKTYLPKCLQENELKPLAIFSMIDIADSIKKDGEFEIQTDKLIYLDDVGTEEATVNHYGTKITWFKDFIELYYSKNKPFNKLIVSTNNSFKDLEDKYGFRVRSRMREMFNIVEVDGKDMRE